MSIMPGKLLGEFSFRPQSFKDIDKVFQEFSKPAFKNLNDRAKNDRISKKLFDCIDAHSAPCFLLPHVVDFMTRIEEKKVLDRYNMNFFELWLNQYSGMDEKTNQRIRGKIVGKWIPREAYQVFFPIGMGRRYAGSHFVTAHSSPDLDTTISSFWGWVDAFGARVSEGLHMWNVPGGPPEAQIEIPLIFEAFFGSKFFRALAKSRSSLALTSVDLLSQRGFAQKHFQDTTFSVDHERMNNAVVLVDDGGFFLGDWRNMDAEGVRHVIMSLHHCLRWLESHLLFSLISLFAKEDLHRKDIAAFVKEALHIKIRDLGPMNDFTDKQRANLIDYLVKVLNVSKGIDAEFAEFASGLATLGVKQFQDFLKTLTALEKSSIFNGKGRLVENRPEIFHTLENIIKGLSKGLQEVRSYSEQLGICLQIKSQVFGYFPQVISARAEVEEIRSKMSNYLYLTVTISDAKGRLVPLGIIHASDVHKPILGTVSLRDFNNREETRIPSYIEVISVIDHHKSSLNTLSAPMALISDAQSSNGLVADLTFQINDLYSTGGMEDKKISQQIEKLSRKIDTASSARTFSSLLKKKTALERADSYFIDTQREFLEYLHFMYAILDDTDLLSKVTMRDVTTAACLLNRMKTIAEGKEVEIIHFDDIPVDENFVKTATKRILQNEDMFSLYEKIYLSKEESIDRNLKLCMQRKSSNIFADTKVQNGCARVGQTKLFPKNFAVFAKGAETIRSQWIDEARAFYHENMEVDLHLQMMTTVAGTKELLEGVNENWKHSDELWMWIPETDSAIEHAKSFLNSLKSSPHILNNKLEVAFLGKNTREWEKIFYESFVPIPRKHLPGEAESKFSMAVLFFRAGSMNSRKAMISPYLPKLIR